MMKKSSSPARRALHAIAAAVGTFSLVLFVAPSSIHTLSAADPAAAGTTARRSLASFDTMVERSARQMMEEGRRIFRFDTFGDEVYWTDVLGLNRAVAGEKNGGVGAGVSPKAALELGLKVDMDALPADLVTRIKAGAVNLDDPATTLALIKLNAVVGVVGTTDTRGNVSRVGLTCAVCHSTVDDAFSPGIGHRLDGFGNRDLNVGAIVAATPGVGAIAKVLNVDLATVKKVLAAWGPGKFDAELDKDGKGFRPDGKTAATIIPNAFGLAGVNNHTWTGAWGNVTYWNAYVAATELKGKGTFYDPRLNDPKKYPVSARTGAWNTRGSPDMITSKLAALQFYQLAIPAPPAPAGTFDASAATRGRALFEGKARCAGCHVPPLFTEPGWNLHTAKEIGIDDFQASRSPDNRYRTAPLRGLWTYMKGAGPGATGRGFYHDGRFSDLEQVIRHYDRLFSLGLSETEVKDLAQYLRSL